MSNSYSSVIVEIPALALFSLWVFNMIISCLFALSLFPLFSKGEASLVFTVKKMVRFEEVVSSSLDMRLGSNLLCSKPIDIVKR